MPSFVQVVVFGILAAAGLGLALLVGQRDVGLGVFTGAAGVVIAVLVGCAIKVANQWERGVVLRLGELRGVRGPGASVTSPMVWRTDPR
jgi:regulator of protease activity HflC (stomatin/prohibitin superfamily)